MKRRTRNIILLLLIVALLAIPAMIMFGLTYYVSHEYSEIEEIEYPGTSFYPESIGYGTDNLIFRYTPQTDRAADYIVTYTLAEIEPPDGQHKVLESVENRRYTISPEEPLEIETGPRKIEYTYQIDMVIMDTEHRELHRSKMAATLPQQ
ncbi:hypothetical protein Mzhil_1697 [Methanosalsum zhilinae DSM 4017]|uniref:Uncharacterized protein n=1 Tax=Methanosalsum zhilinae (strain DSM 4017 / NBRC 107636 / OCM 62 / WeN5) TaxID=679901 RepID=F7XQ05_METZD|nr:hypothetical protein [Methanosalsum zhilinae]AEH61532.1 hypothetical protein Mzhil_1697 [Methanosalsum zhilinae DSM 4017]